MMWFLHDDGIGWHIRS